MVTFTLLKLFKIYAKHKIFIQIFYEKWKLVNAVRPFGVCVRACVRVCVCVCVCVFVEIIYSYLHDYC